MGNAMRCVSALAWGCALIQKEDLRCHSHCTDVRMNGGAAIARENGCTERISNVGANDASENA